MTTLNSTLQLALLKRKKARNKLEKGFTLVELMIVIVIVGILSAVALPNFIGTKDKAEAGATIGSMTGLAKECSVNAIQESGQAIPGVTADSNATEGILLVASDGSAGSATEAANNCKYGGEISNIKGFTADKIEGMKCGAIPTTAGTPADPNDSNSTETTDSNINSGDNTICTLTILEDGSITGAWS